MQAVANATLANSNTNQVQAEPGKKTNGKAPGSHRPDASTINTAHAPGHWVLARLGKKVLRPGGLGATRILLSQMNITRNDHVVEFAPGLGLTAEMILGSNPASYVGVERDVPAARRLRSFIEGRGRVYDGSAECSGLPTAEATRVIGEAMLSMHPVQTKAEIIREASRLLKPGGLYGIHELVLRPDNAPQHVRRDLCRAMSKAIHHGVTPLSTQEWLGLLDEEGFAPMSVEYIPFRLLSPARLVADEGWAGALKFGLNLLRDGDARRRVMEMRKVFGKYRDNLSAIVIVARKK